jgi:hypothetical protein
MNVELVSKEVMVSKKVVNLTLSIEEAVALYAVVANTGGHSDNCLRVYTNELYNQLDKIMKIGTADAIAIAAYSFNLMGLVKAQVNESGTVNAVELCRKAAKLIEERL